MNSMDTFIILKQDNDYDVSQWRFSYNSGLIHDGKQWIDIDYWLYIEVLIS